ncbi:hypothetical protein [Streptomyces sp. NPDC058953]|uniref:hypothetical protein n=1 Tax=unclassified Streptomyces TaxID=2593676 RepID=UPI0036B16D57
MGLTVLYIAFGVVALWLLGEVLLQYKARLRWRLLAFGGFLVVVLGVLVASRVVIALGAIAFAVGQTYVTLSFRKGFSTGWALGGHPGASRRRKDGPREPSLEVTSVEETRIGFEGPDAPDMSGAGASVTDTMVHGFPVHDADMAAHGADADPGGPAPVYEPQPMPDDTGQYGVYGDGSYGTAAHQDGPHPEPGRDGGAYDANTGAYDGGYDPYYAPGAPGAHSTPGYEFGGQDPQQYPGYADPYPGDGQQQYAPGYDGGYDSFGNPQPYGQDPAYYEQAAYTDTPPGGVWVPQQRDTGAPGQPGDEQPPYDQGQGFDNESQQYRY